MHQCRFGCFSPVSQTDIIGVIPAHLASIRFPEKVLYPFFGHPMIEHVRRRAMASTRLKRVYVATCDEKIAATVRDYGGEVLMTDDRHQNGTTRVADAVESLDCSHVVLLQGDEPLLMPGDIDTMVAAIETDSESDAWNAVAPLDAAADADKHSFVKCALGHHRRILYCFRRNPSHAAFDEARGYIRKILGLIAFRKESLMRLVDLSPSVVEQLEFIEQMRMIDHGMTLTAVPFERALPSVNEPHEADIVIDYVNQHPEQKRMIERIFPHRDGA